MSLKTFNITYTEKQSVEASANFEKTGVIIVAAGNASRMSGQNKILADILGEPVIVRTIKAFEQVAFVSDIVIVTRADMVLDIENLISSFSLSKVTDIVVGGASRQESVRNGFEVLKDREDIKNVLIHDGARPLVTKKVIENVVLGAEEFGAAIPTVPAKDTVKKIGALGKVTETLNRSELCLVQTPQGFSLECYKKSLEAAGEKLSEFTDDSGVVENAGYSVYTTHGDYNNIKITTPEDLSIARAILSVEEGL